MTKKILFTLFIFLPCLLIAQKKYTISGYIKDARNGETLIGATIALKDNVKGISSNQFGFFSLTLTEGKYDLVGSYVGFQPPDPQILGDRKERRGASPLCTP